MIRGETANIKYLLIYMCVCVCPAPPQQIDSADLAFDDIRMDFDQHNPRFIRLYQEEKTQSEQLPRPAVDCEMDIPTDDHKPSSSNIKFRQSSAT